MIGAVAEAGKKSSEILRTAVSNMLQKKRARLPMRLVRAVEQATPARSAVNPKPLNQLKRIWLPAQYLK